MGGLSESEIVSKRINGYLRALEVSLLKVDPAIAEETLQEIRQHLHASASELIAQGHPASEAAQLAINRFGPVYKVGPRLSKELRRVAAHDKAVLRSKLILYVQLLILAVMIGPSTLKLGHNIVSHIGLAILAGFLNAFLETLRGNTRPHAFPRFGLWFYARIALVCALLVTISANPLIVSAGLLYIAIAIQIAVYKFLTPTRLRAS